MSSKKDRVFTTKDTDGNEWVIKFVRPSQKVLNKGELVFRTVFSLALREGVLTNAEVDKILRERGIWDDEKEAEAEVMRVATAEFEKKLNDASLTNEQGKQVCDEITRQRLELIRHNSIYTSVADNTCENMASEARNQFLCAECIFDNKTGLRVYKSVEDFKDRLDESSAIEAYRETVIASLEIMLGRDLPSDLTTEYAENRWLEERGLLDIEADEDEDKEDEKEKPKSKKKKLKKAS